MKDLLHQALFLLVTAVIITLLRLILGPWISFLGQTSIVLYVVLVSVLAVITVLLYILNRNT